MPKTNDNKPLSKQELQELRKKYKKNLKRSDLPLSELVAKAKKKDRSYADIMNGFDGWNKWAGQQEKRAEEYGLKPLDPIPDRRRADYKTVMTEWNKARIGRHDIELRLGMDYNTIQSIVADMQAWFQGLDENDQKGLKRLVSRDSKGNAQPLNAISLEGIQDAKIDVGEAFQGARVHILTAAQIAEPGNGNFFASLKRLQEYRDAKLTVGPLKYGPLKVDKNGDPEMTFDSMFHGHMLFDDVKIAGGNLNLNTMRMRPTLETFLTGRVCQIGDDTSQVFFAPRPELRNLPRIGDGGYRGQRTPKAIMTSMAATHANYPRDPLGQPDRTGGVAMEEHTFGAVIVEIEKDGKSFHFRQLISDKNGCFYDIDPVSGGAIWVTPDGVKQAPEDAIEALFMGDWHTGMTEPKVREATFTGAHPIVNTLKPKNVITQDDIDGFSVNPYDRSKRRDLTMRTLKNMNGWDSLKKELEATASEHIMMLQNMPEETILHRIAANHPEYVTDYIKDPSKWQDDPVNALEANKLFGAMLEHRLKQTPNRREIATFDPVDYAIRPMIEEAGYGDRFKSYGRKDVLEFPKGLKRDQRIICSVHGDVGLRGAQTRSSKEFLNLGRPVLLGHNHSAEIHGRDGVWRVGTSTVPLQHYCENPATNWTHTHAVVFKNGQRMLLNIVDGKWHGQDVKGSGKKAKPSTKGVPRAANDNDNDFALTG